MQTVSSTEPAPKQPEPPTKSSNSSLLQAGNKNIHTHGDTTCPESLVYAGKVGGMLHFKVNLDHAGNVTTQCSSAAPGILIANGFAPYDKFLLVGAKTINKARLRTVNLRDEDLPAPMLEKIVACQCSRYLNELIEIMEFHMIEWDQFDLAKAFFYIKDMALPIEWADIRALIKVIPRVIACLAQEEEFLNTCQEVGEDILEDLQFLLAMAKAVSLHPAKRAAGKEGEAA